MTNVGIYSIISPSGKIYIGQSWDIIKRSKHYKRMDCKNQAKLHNSFIKHGYDKHLFKVIHELPSDIDQSILDLYEFIYIKAYKACGVELLNLKEGGLGGKMSEMTRIKMRNSRVGKKHSFETLQKMGISQLGNKNGKGNKGIIKSEKTKRLMSEAKKGHATWLGKKHTEESKIKMSHSRIGNKNAAGKDNAGIKNPFYGKKHSEESKLRMSESQKRWRFNKKVCTISSH